MAGERVGALAVNRTRLLFAVALLSLSHLVLEGSPLPLSAPAHAWMYLGLSGLIGLSLGDTFLFKALLELGPRRAMLVMASWPIFSTLLALLLLQETISLREGAGIFLTVAGITWVLLERRAPSRQEAREGSGFGVALALGGALCQALGVVLAKQGLTGGFPPLSGTLIRMVVATVGLWLLAPLFQVSRSPWAVFQDRRALAATAMGAVTGPFLGVWLSLVAVAHAKVGVASALMALVPILILPLVRIFFGERVSLRALLGTTTAVAGVLLLTPGS